MDKIKKYFLLLSTLFLLTLICPIFAIAQANLSPKDNPDFDKSIYNKSLASYRNTVGNIGEFFMDDYYSMQKWEKIPSKIGFQGIDGLYVMRDKKGVIRRVLVAESKYGSSSLSITKYGDQMSHQWVVKKISELISRNEKQLERCLKTACNDLQKLQQTRKDLEAIKKITSQEMAYRREIFRADIANGELRLKFIKLKDGIQKISGQLTFSLKSPRNAGDREVYKKFFNATKNELVAQGLSETDATNTVNEIKSKFESGEIKTRQQMQKVLINKIYDNKIKYAKSPATKQLYRCMKQYALLNNKVPPRLQSSANAAIMVGALSSVSHGYMAFTGEESILDASKAVFTDTSLAGGSIYASEAVIQNINGRIVITTLLSENAKKALGAGLNIAVAVFIFDQSLNTYAFVNGNMTENEFLRQTSKSLIKTAAIGTTAYCAVLLGASPGGPVLMAISIASYIVVDSSLNHFEKIQKRNYLTIEDLLWQLPIGIKSKKTIMDYELLVDSSSLLELDSKKDNSILGIDSDADKSILNINEKKQKAKFPESILGY